MYKADYSNSLVNLSNSILKHFHTETKHNSIPEVDKALEGKKRVVVFLFDGLGQYIIDSHLKEDGFFRTHKLHTITSTYPPTTVAATSAFLSALEPIESGWLGWVQYFKHMDRNIKVFRNTDAQTRESFPRPLILEQVSPYESIISQINKANNKEVAHFLQCAPLDKSFTSKFMSLFIKKAYRHAHMGDESFVYAYWNTPDKLLHEFGVFGKKSHKNVTKIERLTKRYSKRNKDVATLIIADHGFHDVTYLTLQDYPDLVELMERPFSLEGRASNFFIKEGKQEEFRALFNKYFGDKFELYSKEEYLNNGLFGNSKPNDVVNEFLGDFVAVAIKEYSLQMKPSSFPLKAHHAGGTKEEMLIDVIGINI